MAAVCHPAALITLLRAIPLPSFGSCQWSPFSAYPLPVQWNLCWFYQLTFSRLPKPFACCFGWAEYCKTDQPHDKQDTYYCLPAEVIYEISHFVVNPLSRKLLRKYRLSFGWAYARSSIKYLPSVGCSITLCFGVTCGTPITMSPACSFCSTCSLG